jgi:NADPH2:quinone reductase
MSASDAVTMRAVVIAKPGEAESLDAREVAKPRATGDRVRVRIFAAALNRADLLQRAGKYPAPPGAPQDVPGLEFAGEVEQLGDEARRWKIGQRVFGITGGGGQAEYVVVPENHLAEVPKNLSWAEAAAVPEAFITAHDALFTQAGLSLGETVLIHAVGSGVGLAAVQLARAAGAGIFGTARTAEKLERAKSFGLEHAVRVKEDASVFAAEIERQTNGAGVNVILDLVGASYLAANLAALSAKGRMVLVGTMGGASAPLNYGAVMRKRLQIMGTALRSRSTEEKATATRLFAAHVVPLLANGRVKAVIDSVFDLKDVRAAYERLESNQTFGKVVLRIKD